MQRIRVFALIWLFLISCAGASPKPDTPEPSAPREVVEPTAARSLVERRCELPVAGAWPTFQSDARRHGVSTAPTIREPQIRWKADVGIQGWLNNPVIVDDMVFVGSNGSIWNKPDASDGVYALDLENGEVRWFAPAENDVNGVAYADCFVISTSDDGGIRAHDAMTGEVVWTHRVEERKVYTNPLIIGRRVLTGDSAGIIRAMDLRTGEEEWVADMRAGIRGGLSSDGSHVFAATETGLIRAFELEGGTPRWSASLDPWGVYASPTIVAGKLIVGFIRDTTYSRPALAAFDLESGEAIWRGSNPRGFGGGWGNIRSSPAVWRSLLIWGEPYSNRVIAADMDNGEVVWSSPTGPCLFPHWPSPAVVRDQVLMPRHGGGLWALSAEDGTVQWSIYLGDQTRVGTEFPRSISTSRRCEWDPPVGRPIFSSPAVASDGTIVVGTGEGILYAIEEAEEP